MIGIIVVDAAALDTVGMRFSRPRWRWLLLAVPILMVIIGGCSADWVILGSNHDSLDASGLTRQVITHDGRAVECWLARSPGAQSREPEAIVLFLPGQRARAEPWTAMVAGAWGDHPVEVWGLNFPGYGGSDSTGRLADVAPSAIAAYDDIHARHPTRRIFIHAASFGTAVALKVARERPVAGLLLQNPPPLKQLILGRYGWWNLWLLAGPVACKVPDDLDSLANAANVRAPAVFIISTGDGIVPESYQRRVAAAYAGPKRIVENSGAGHSDGLSAEAARGASEGRDWLWSNLR